MRGAIKARSKNLHWIKAHTLTTAGLKLQHHTPLNLRFQSMNNIDIPATSYPPKKIESVTMSSQQRKSNTVRIKQTQ